MLKINSWRNRSAMATFSTVVPISSLWIITSVQRKSVPDKHTPRPKNPQSMDEPEGYELEDSLQNTDPQATRSKRPKRSKKSVNETLEPAFTAASPVVPKQT